MSTPGILIAIEGIDGSGKHTQAKLLEHALASHGYSVYATGFPQYDSWFGSMVGKFLNGDFGSLEAVDPHFSALLYAGDRYEAKARIQGALNEGKVVLVDRYVASNLKAERNYTRATHDLQEKSLRHLEDAAEMYDMLSRSKPWATVQCFDAQSGTLRLPEEISTEVLSAVQSVLAPANK